MNGATWSWRSGDKLSWSSSVKSRERLAQLERAEQERKERERQEQERKDSWSWKSS